MNPFSAYRIMSSLQRKNDRPAAKAETEASTPDIPQTPTMTQNSVHKTPASVARATLNETRHDPDAPSQDPKAAIQTPPPRPKNGAYLGLLKNHESRIEAIKRQEAQQQSPFSAASPSQRKDFPPGYAGSWNNLPIDPPVGAVIMPMTPVSPRQTVVPAPVHMRNDAPLSLNNAYASPAATAFVVDPPVSYPHTEQKLTLVDHVTEDRWNSVERSPEYLAAAGTPVAVIQSVPAQADPVAAQTVDVQPVQGDPQKPSTHAAVTPVMVEEAVMQPENLEVAAQEDAPVVECAQAELISIADEPPTDEGDLSLDDPAPPRPEN